MEKSMTLGERAEKKKSVFVAHAQSDGNAHRARYRQRAVAPEVLRVEEFEREEQARFNFLIFSSALFGLQK